MPEDAAAPATSTAALHRILSHVSSSRPNAGPNSIVVVDPPSSASEGVTHSRRHAAIALAAGDTVELLDGDGHLEDTLVFTDAFPSSTSQTTRIQALTYDASTSRIAASADDRIAVWTRNAKGDFKVHSTLTTGFPVETFDFRGGTLVAGGAYLAAYELADTYGLPTWSRRVHKDMALKVTQLSLSNDGKMLVSSFEDHHVAQISRVAQDDAGRLAINVVSLPWHPAPVLQTQWLEHPFDPVVLITTIDGVVRFWRSMPNDPDAMVLWACFDPGSLFGSIALTSYWLPSDGHRQSCVFSISQEGALAKAVISNFNEAATHAAKVSIHIVKSARIPRAQLSRLRYSRAVATNDRLDIVGVSKRGSFLHVRASLDPHSGRVSIERTAGSRILPSESIALADVSHDDLAMVSVGVRGEVLFWRGSCTSTKLAMMQAVARGRVPGVDVRPSQIACSACGQVAAIVTSREVYLFKRNDAAIQMAEIGSSVDLDASDILGIALGQRQGDVQTLTIIARTGQVWTADISPELQVSNQDIALLGIELAKAFLVQRQPTVSFTKAIAVSPQGAVTEILVHDMPAGPSSVKHAALDLTIQAGDLTQFCAARASYFAAATRNQQGSTVRIYNARAALFTSGLEFTLKLGSEEEIVALSFTAGSHNHQMPGLLVVTKARTVILSPRRLSYYQENSMWIPVASLDIRSPFPITVAIWLPNDSIFVATGSQTHLLSAEIVDHAGRTAQICNRISELNRPLPDYHPQMLMQCLLAGKFEIADKVFSRLLQAAKDAETRDAPFFYESLPLGNFTRAQQDGVPSASDYVLRSFAIPDTPMWSDEDEDRLFLAIKHEHSLDLTSDEREHLRVLVETVFQCKAQRRALDENGMRFLTSLRSFAITQAQALETPAPSRAPSPTPTFRSRRFLAHPLARLRYRDVLWGFHSESQDILLTACTDVCGGPMLWQDARALGVSLWVKSPQVLAGVLEQVARNEYTAPEDRDPTVCSLYYFALRKKRLVQGLWKQATFHKERGVMLKFLMNDFDEPRWKSAALKNAFALMGKQRFHYAAAFFLLGDSLKDCINVCMKQLNDFQLAVMLARVYEGDEGPVLKDILQSHVLPLAFARGYRRLASWAFWMLKRRDLAVRVILTPLSELAVEIANPAIKDVSNPAQEDPSLVLLYSQLRDWSLQTLRGSSAISPLRETQFISHMAQVLVRMGCHVLALDLVRNWEFRSARDQIFALLKKPAPASKASTHANGVAVDHIDGQQNGVVKEKSRPSLSHHRRRSSTLAPKRKSTIILDVPSAVPSRAPSPERKLPSTLVAEPASDLNEAKKQEDQEGFKKVVREVKAPPPEFDMSAFGF